VAVTFSAFTGHTLGNIWAVTVMTPPRLNFCNLGNVLIYENVAGTLTAEGAGDLKQDIPATLVWTGSSWIHNNPSLPVLSTTQGRVPAQPKLYRKIIIGAYKVVTGDQGNEIACINAPYTVSLDLAANLSQQFFYIKRVGPTGQVITIAVTGTAPLELIYPPGSATGATTFTLDDTLDSVQLQCNGVDFHILTVAEPRKTVPTVYTTPGTYTYTTAAWQTSVLLTGCAAGGSGSPAYDIAAGPVGGAGQWVYKQSYPVTPSTGYTVTIPGTATGTGGTCSFGVVLVLTGGGYGLNGYVFTLTADTIAVSGAGEAGPFGVGGPAVVLGCPSGFQAQLDGLPGQGYGAGGSGAVGIGSGASSGGTGSQGFLVVE
jgi:hypothetical protein